MKATNSTPFLETVRTLGPSLAEGAPGRDQEGRFVVENYALLKQHKLFSAGVPSELGGGGASHAELSQMLREIAHHCGSTALALSMHTHLVAAAVWRHRHGQPAEALLRKVAAAELVLVSTGAGDWVDSTGHAERAEGGYHVSAIKGFASGCLAGNLLLTSAPFFARAPEGALRHNDPERGAEVLHFALPLSAPGVSIREDWDTLGMRATGSHSVELKQVFVPDEAISLRRPRGQWHPSWNVILSVAPPLYTAPYVGLAEAAAHEARTAAAKRPPDAILFQLLGELENTLTACQMAFREMVELTNEYDFAPEDTRASRMLVRKTLATNAARSTVAKAVEIVGGSAYFRRAKLERLWRDVQGAPFHPLPEKRQLELTGRVSLGLSPVGS
jgi:alkylation response protein AidB-like acyl-CoA dehydrogenase